MASCACKNGITFADVKNPTTPHQHARAVEAGVTRRSYVAVPPFLARPGHEAALSAHIAVSAFGLAVTRRKSARAHACNPESKENSHQDSCLYVLLALHVWLKMSCALHIERNIYVKCVCPFVR